MDFPFFDLCNGCLEKISREKTANSKYGTLKKAIKEFGQANGNVIFPLMRLIIPSLDKDRGNFNIQETKLASLYLKSQSIAKESKDGASLLGWKQNSGDISVLIESIMRDRTEKRKSSIFTIKSINELLDDLTKSDTEADRANSYQQFIIHATPLEHKWLARIILKHLKLGLSQNSILKTIHPKAPEYALVCSNLLQICEKFQQEDQNLSSVSSDVILGSGFRPMLADRIVFDVDNFKSITKGLPFRIETKLDGERMQLHKLGKDSYRYFSRGGIDMSGMFGLSSSQGSLTPIIHKFFLESVETVVLDGEMMVYDESSGTFESFGTLKTAGKHHCFVIFDITFLNGQTLTTLPLEKRLSILNTRIFGMTEKGRLQIMQGIVGSSIDDVSSALEQSMENFEEGIVVKLLGSLYELGTRSKSWLKVKPEYLSGLVEDIDLLVVGCSYGKRLKGCFSSFHLAICRKGPDENSEPSHHLISFAKVGNGFKHNQLEEISGKLEGNLKPFNEMDLPPWMTFGSEKPEFILKDPIKFCLVFCVRATEIIPSGKFAAKYTLRFPRFVSVKVDKPFSDILSHDEMVAIKDQESGKLAKRNQDMDWRSTSGSNRTAKKRPLASLLPSHQPANLKEIKVESSIFQGKTFIVVKGNETLSKQGLEIILYANGAQITQNGDEKHVLVISGNDHGANVAKYIKAELNVVKVSWIEDCLQAGRMIPLLPKHVYSATPSTRSMFSDYVDPYEDEYGRCMEKDEFKAFMEGMQITPLLDIQQKRLAKQEVAKRYLKDDLRTKLFGMKLFVSELKHHDPVVCLRVQRLLCYWRSCGLEVVHSNHQEECTHFLTIVDEDLEDYCIFHSENSMSLSLAGLEKALSLPPPFWDK